VNDAYEVPTSKISRDATSAEKARRKDRAFVMSPLYGMDVTSFMGDHVPIALAE
jgi:hypothetical protein